MADETLLRDQNHVTVIGAITDDASQEIRMIRVDPSTNRVLASITGAGSGSVTDVSVVTANGISGSVANPTTTPAITLTLGAITPTSVNSVVISGASTPTLAVTGTTSVSGTNTGDQTSVSGNAGTATALQTPRTIGGVSFDGTANITVATATGGFTVSGGALALGANNLTMTGSLAATGARVTKGWFTDIESTNMPTVGGTSLSSTFAPLASPTFTGTVTTPAIKITTGAGSGKVLTSDADGDATWEDPASSIDAYAVTSKPTTYRNYQVPVLPTSATALIGWTSTNVGSMVTTRSGFNQVTTTGGNGFIRTPLMTSDRSMDSVYTFAQSKKIVVSWDLALLSAQNYSWGLTDNGASDANFCSITSNINSARFTWDNTGATLQARTGKDGVGSDATTIAGVTISSLNTYRIEFDPGSEVRYYVNGVLRVTHTTGTNFPVAGSPEVNVAMPTSASIAYFGSPVVSIEA